MLTIVPGLKVHLACKPFDMGRGFDGLAADVAQVLRADPYSGAVFAFRSRRAERAIRALTFCRRNYLFGSDEEGCRAAIFYTLISTVRLNGLDPQPWLTCVISRIAGRPVSRLDELLPWAWQAGRPQHARTA